LHPKAFLESERLYYRPIMPDDLPWLIEMRSPENVARYLGGSRLQNPEALAERMKFYMECYEKYGIGLSVMTLKSTGEQIGTSGLQPLEDTGEIEVGYNMSERFWGQGYGTECARAWLNYGFGKLGLERIVAIAHPDNLGSWRIMEKCGMTFEKREEHYGIECLFYAVSRADFDLLHQP
jgi:ribosomal-protein-alanine N-acetyltransferase